MRPYRPQFRALLKQTRPIQGRDATFIITEMAVFTLETDYSCETGYPFNDSRQIGNMS